MPKVATKKTPANGDAATPPTEHKRGSKKLVWTETEKGKEWRAPTEHPSGARIKGFPLKRKEDERYYVYMDGLYYGTDDTLEKAMGRAERREMSQRAATMGEPGSAPGAEDAPVDERIQSVVHGSGAGYTRKQADEAAKRLGKPLAKLTRDEVRAEIQRATGKPAAKAAMPAAPPEARGGSVRSTGFGSDDVIESVDKRNPRRPGTVQWERYEVIIKNEGATMRQFIDAGGDGQALKYAAKTGHAKIKPAGS